MTVLPHGRDAPRSRKVLTLLVLAALTIVAVDYAGGEQSPVEPLREATGQVLGPTESAFEAATRPVEAIQDWFTTVDGLRDDNAALERENAALRAELEAVPYDRNRLAQYEALRQATEGSGFSTVEAQVVAVGPAQTFSRTVTIDAGSSDGVRADMTVLNADGLVGRVVRADSTTATVLLVIDADSVVGGRLGASLELGLLRGDGEIGEDGRLTLSALDPDVRPQRDDAVVTWGSENGVPYVAGVPIGQVESVRTDQREQSATIVVEPYVDFSSLDLVSVVVGPDPGRSAEAAGER